MSEAKPTLDSSDETLFSRIAAGDTEAFALFYDRYESMWFGLALRVLQNPVDAEDVLQEAAILLWERARQYDKELGRPANWAVTLVRNKAIDRLRHNRRIGVFLERVEGENSAPNASPTSDSPVPVACVEAAEIVRRTLYGLPAEQRQAIELAFFSGMTQSEIANHLGHPLGTIKARIRRGMIAMRDALEGAL